MSGPESSSKKYTKTTKTSSSKSHTSSTATRISRSEKLPVSDFSFIEKKVDVKFETLLKEQEPFFAENPLKHDTTSQQSGSQRELESLREKSTPLLPKEKAKQEEVRQTLKEKTDQITTIVAPELEKELKEHNKEFNSMANDIENSIRKFQEKVAELAKEDDKENPRPKDGSEPAYHDARNKLTFQLSTNLNDSLTPNKVEGMDITKAILDFHLNLANAVSQANLPNSDLKDFEKKRDELISEAANLVSGLSKIKAVILPELDTKKLLPNKEESLKFNKFNALLKEKNEEAFLEAKMALTGYAESFIETAVAAAREAAAKKPTPERTDLIRTEEDIKKKTGLVAKELKPHLDSTFETLSDKEPSEDKDNLPKKKGGKMETGAESMMNQLIKRHDNNNDAVITKKEMTNALDNHYYHQHYSVANDIVGLSLAFAPFALGSAAAISGITAALATGASISVSVIPVIGPVLGAAVAASFIILGAVCAFLKHKKDKIIKKGYLGNRKIKDMSTDEMADVLKELQTFNTLRKMIKEYKKEHPELKKELESLRKQMSKMERDPKFDNSLLKEAIKEITEGLQADLENGKVPTPADLIELYESLQSEALEIAGPETEELGIIDPQAKPEITEEETQLLAQVQESLSQSLAEKEMADSTAKPKAPINIKDIHPELQEALGGAKFGTVEEAAEHLNKVADKVNNPDRQIGGEETAMLF